MALPRESEQETAEISSRVVAQANSPILRILPVDGAVVTASTDGAICYWDSVTWNQKLELPTVKDIVVVDVTSDGSWVVAASADHLVVTGPACPDPLTTNPGNISALVITGLSEKFLTFVVGDHSEIREWSIYMPEGVPVSADSSLIHRVERERTYSAGRDDPFDDSYPTMITSSAIFDAAITEAREFPDQLLFFVTDEGKVEMTDGPLHWGAIKASPKEGDFFSPETTVGLIDVTPDGETILYYDGDSVRVIEDYQEILLVAYQFDSVDVRCIAAMPDGKSVAIGTDEHLYVKDFVGQDWLVEKVESPVKSVAALLEKGVVLTGHADGSLRSRPIPEPVPIPKSTDEGFFYWVSVILGGIVVLGGVVLVAFLIGGLIGGLIGYISSR